MSYSAFETKFLPVTNTLGARIKATALTTNPGTGRRPSEIFSIDSDLTTFHAHKEAAWYFCRRYLIPRDNDAIVSFGATDSGYVWTVLRTADPVFETIDQSSKKLINTTVFYSDWLRSDIFRTKRELGLW